MDGDTLTGSLSRLASALEPLRFHLLPPTQRADLVRHRDRLRQDVDGYGSRLRHPDAPLLIIIGGVTGAGKSTLINSLVGIPVAATGVTRPTTISPTLVCHPDDVAWFLDDRVLPSLPRVAGDATGRRGSAGVQEVLTVVGLDEIPAGLAIVDAPDSDSVRRANRDLADLLLDAADVWFWVTTQGKYADEGSMALLRRAGRRGAAVVTALTQVEPDRLSPVVDDFAAKAAVEGLPDVRVFVVPRATVTDEQLPDPLVYDVRDWLWSLADPERRAALREQTLRGALAALPAEVEELVAALDMELRTHQGLTGAAADRYTEAAVQFADLLDKGKISLRKQVLQGWADFVGTGRFQALIETAYGRARAAAARLLNPMLAARGSKLEKEVREEALDTVRTRVRQVADVAAGDVAQAWLRDPVARHLLEGNDDLHRSGPDLEDRVADAMTTWEEGLRELVAEQGADRRDRAQVYSTVGNAVVATLMLASFAATGGLTGAEVVLAGGSATALQWVLEKALGTGNVRWLVREARQSLLEAVEGVLAAERRRYTDALARLAPDPDAGERITEALAGVVESSR